MSRNSVEYDPNASCSQLRREFKKYITHLKHGKHSEEKRNRDKVIVAEKQRNNAIAAEESLHVKHQEIVDNLPQVVQSDLKDQIIKIFHEETSREQRSIAHIYMW